MASASIQEKLVDCWNHRDFDSYKRLLHSEYSYVGTDGKVLKGGPQTGVDVAKMYAAAFPDAVLTITKVVTSGDTLVCEMVGRGTHGGNFMGIPATHKPVEVFVCNIVTLKDGKVLKEREYMDAAHVLRQIGAIIQPPPLTTQPATSAPAHH